MVIFTYLNKLAMIRLDRYLGEMLQLTIGILFTLFFGAVGARSHCILKRQVIPVIHTNTLAIIVSHDY